MTTEPITSDTCSCGSTTPTSSIRADYLTPAQLVAYLDNAVTVGTLRNWRCDRRGPRFISIGRDIRYPLGAVTTWLAELDHH